MVKKANDLRVALVGGYPPPYGGVSIHIQRLHTQCLKNKIRCTVYDISRHVKKVRHVIPNTISVLTPPPYAEGQSVKVAVKRGSLHAVPMLGQVASVDESSVKVVFGGGKEETLALNPDGSAVTSELSKPEKKKS